ncbi:MAG: helix-hairpin-helix domain-containing protein [Candidatus Glassbacteria bacterium]
MLFTRNQALTAVGLTVAAVGALALRLSTRGGAEAAAFRPAVADSAVLARVAAEVDRGALPVNVNLASNLDLQALDGIGPVLADRIVAERERGGPFTDGAELSDRVRGIGPATVAGLAGRITFAADSAGRAGRP